MYQSHYYINIVLITLNTNAIVSISIIQDHRGFIPINPKSVSHDPEIFKDNSGWIPLISYTHRAGRYAPYILHNTHPAITVPFVMKPKSRENYAIHNVKDFQSEIRDVNQQNIQNDFDSKIYNGNKYETKSYPNLNSNEGNASLALIEALPDNSEFGKLWGKLLREIDTKLAVLVKENFKVTKIATAPASKSNDTDKSKGKSHAIGRRISPHTEAGYDVPLILNSQRVAANKSTTVGDYRDSASKVRHVGNSLASDVDIPTSLSSGLMSTFQPVDIPHDRVDNGNESEARSYKNRGDLKEDISSRSKALISPGFNSTNIKHYDPHIHISKGPNKDTKTYNFNVAESVIHIQNSSYKHGNDSEKDTIRQNITNEVLKNTKSPNYLEKLIPDSNKYEVILDMHMKKYNILNTNRLLNYDISRIPRYGDRWTYSNQKRNVWAGDDVKLIGYKLQGYNSLNHLPPDPIAAVWLSQYGHYDPTQHGRSSFYRNLYSYLASNNMHNNKPFASYKIFKDTDV